MAERAGLFGSQKAYGFTSQQTHNSRASMDEKRMELFWTKLCNQEKSSKLRNQALMDDFERVEQQAAVLAAQTQKLRQLKDQYESYINTMYPRWLNELKHHKQSLQDGRHNANHNMNQGSHQQGETRHIRRPPGNVRFASPTNIQQEQESQLTSSLQDTQNTQYPDNTYFDQSSFPQSSGRFTNLDWDSYHRDSSADFYHFGPVSSMRTPHGHFHPRNDYMRFSTPYNPIHNGRFDSMSSMGQSYDMYGEFRGYGARGANMGSPIRYPGPPTHMNGFRTTAYDGDVHFRPEMSDVSHHEPSTRTDDYQQSSICPDISMTEDTHLQNRRRPRGSQQQINRAQSPVSEPSSPYEQPEKPLEHVTDRRQEPEPRDQNRNNRSPKNKANNEASPEPRSDREISGKLEYDDSGQTSSSLALSDLNHGATGPSVKTTKKQTEQETKSKSHSPRDRVKSDNDDSLESSAKTKHGRITSERTPSPREINTQISDDNDDIIPNIDKLKNRRTLSGNCQASHMKPKSDFNDDILDILSDGSLSLSSDNISLDGDDGNDSLHEAVMDYLGGNNLTTTQSTSKQQDLATSKQKKEQHDAYKSTHNNTSTDEQQDETDSNQHDTHGHPVTISDTSSNNLQTGSRTFDKNKSTATKPENNKRRKSHDRDDLHGLEQDDRSDTIDGPKAAMSTSDAPSVSVKGFLSLLKFADEEIEESYGSGSFYRAPRCSRDMKDDIVGRAESGASLETYDPSTVSMVVLDELPKLIRASPSGGLVREQDMEMVISQPNQLSSVLEPSLATLWESVMSHMVHLVECNVAAVDEVSSLFGASLLALNSAYTSKFTDVISGLIKDYIDNKSKNSVGTLLPRRKDGSKEKEDPLDDIHSVTSEESTTLGSTPPQSAKQEDGPKEGPPATPRSLQRTLSYEDDFEDEVDVPLTQTAAYRKIMSSAQSNNSEVSTKQGNSIAHEQDSEGDDDLERTLARSISPPVTSPRQRSPVSANPVVVPEKSKPRRQKPKLNIFGGEDSLGLSYGSDDLAGSWGASSGGLSSTGNGESPPSSPDQEIGYIPTAMEKNKDLPKTATKKPDFWNHSDTESEVDLQLSTGALDNQDDDDFDFYG